MQQAAVCSQAIGPPDMAAHSSEFSLENEVFCGFFMQEKRPPTVRKFRVFVAAISDLVCVCLCLGQAGRFSKCARLFPFELG